MSEGYLGPNLTAVPSPARLAGIKAELRELYMGVLMNWVGQLTSGGELAVCVPAWRRGVSWEYLGVVDDLGRLGYTMKVFKHVRTPLVYARPDSVVGRQILLLRKQ